MRPSSFIVSMLIAICVIVCDGSASRGNYLPLDAAAIPINNLVNAINRHEPSRLGAVFVANPVIVDDFEPYVWTGNNAAKSWYAALQVFSRQFGVKSGYLELGKVSWNQWSGQRQYVTYDSTFTGTLDGKPYDVNGTWTFVLQCSDIKAALAKSTQPQCSIVSDAWSSRR